MTDASRRTFLTAAAGGVAAASGARAQAVPDKAITQVPDWSRHLGEGVAVRQYGTPVEVREPCDPS